ncbi:MAG: glycosyltransferase family 4 protein [Muribaculaceae bacterium]
MRIAFLTMGKDIGGAKQDVITLSQKIAEKGHDVFVISAQGVMDKELSGTKVHFIPAEFYVRNPWGLFKASRTLLQIVKENNIELVNPQGFFTAIISWLMRFGIHPSFIPIVTTIHMFSSLNFYKYAWMLNIFSDQIITESNCERVRLEGGGAKRNKITVVNNSVDMKRFSQEQTHTVLRDEYNFKDNDIVFGIIARLSPEKRHCDFIDAAKLAHTQNSQCQFVVVGDGPMKQELLKQSSNSDFIHFTGARRDIPNVLRSIDCFVLCSEVESLPLSIREAMSMKLVSIVTDVGGNREIVAENITGLLVPSKKPTLLADAMLQIAKSKANRISMGNAAWQFCKDRFDATNWAVYTEMKFKQVLNA